MRRSGTVPRLGENQRSALLSLFAFGLLFVWFPTVQAATGATAILAKCALEQPANEAIQSCTKNLASPNSAALERLDSLLIRGKAHYSLQQFSLASTDFKDALAIKYSSNIAFFLAASEYNLGNNSEAIKLLSKIVGSGEATVEVFALRGMAFQNAGNFDASIADFDKQLALDLEEKGYDWVTKEEAVAV